MVTELHSILVANFDPAISSFFSEALLTEGYMVQQTNLFPHDGAAVLHDLVILGLQPPYYTQPPSLIEYVQKRSAANGAIVACSTSPRLLEHHAITYLPYVYTLALPCNLDQLYAIVERALAI